MTAELKFGIAHEMVLTPMDFFIRRTGRLYFDIDSVREFLDPLLDDFKKAFGYSEDQIDRFKKTMEKELKNHSDFSLERS